MIGYHSKIDGAINLRGQGLFPVGIGQGDGFAFGVFVGAIGIIFLVGEVRVERIACMDV